MKTFTICSLIKFYRKDKGTSLDINSFLALFILIFFSTNLYSQSFTLQSNENYFSPSIFNNDKPRFHVTSEGTITGKPGVRYSISESSPNALAADLDQIRNGGTTDVGTGSGTNWVNGNAGASNAHYAEGWSIAYRMKITDLTPGPHTLIIEWDTRNGNKSAIDFITHYQNMDDPIGSHVSTFGHTQEMMNPIFGFTGLGEATRKEIPEPTLPTNALATFRHLRDDYVDPSGDGFGKEALTIWGGTITDVDYISEGSYTAKDASTRFSITFTSTGSTAIIAWGGHIASRADWGPNNSAGAVNGSSYHTRLISIDGGGGNQDRSLSAAAVIIPPLVCPTITPTSRTVCVGTASMVYTYTPEAGVTYKWTITPGTTAAVLQGAVAGLFTTTGGTVTVVRPTGGEFTAGTFSLNLVMTKVGVTDKTCPFPNVGTVVANPAIYTLSGNAICASAPNTGVITLSNSQTGVSYQLKTTVGNTNTQAAQNGTTGNPLTWTGLPAGVSYYVLATGAAPTSCTSQTTGASISETANPAIYTLSGNAICASAPNTGVITLSNSQTGVSYQLKTTVGNTNTQAAQNGTTGNPLTWTGLPAGVSYYVLATGAAPTSCTSQTTGASITEIANPAIYTLSGNAICASAPNTGVITLSNSQTGVSYQLKTTVGNTNTQAAQNGTTGNPLTWTGLPAGVSYYVLATGAAPTSCTSQTTGASISETANPAIYTLSGNAICASAPNTGVITLSNSQTGVSYQLKTTVGNTNTQAAQNGTTGNPLTWTGLPAGVSYYVLATGAAPTSCTSQTGNASVSETTNPSAPAVVYNAPACDANTFSVTIGSAGNPVIAGASYSIVNKNGGAIAGVSPASPHVATASEATNGFSFTNIPAGSGYQVSITSQSCGSSAATCGVSSSRITTSNAPLGTNNVVVATIQATTPTKVLAAPNPFNDRIRFSLQSAVSGRGSLELYNMLGQKVKVIYQGYVQKGVTQTIEYNVPGAQRANLIYVFTVGDQRITGKLISLK